MVSTSRVRQALLTGYARRVNRVHHQRRVHNQSLGIPAAVPNWPQSRDVLVATVVEIGRVLDRQHQALSVHPHGAFLMGRKDLVLGCLRVLEKLLRRFLRGPILTRRLIGAWGRADKSSAMTFNRCSSRLSPRSIPPNSTSLQPTSALSTSPSLSLRSSPQSIAPAHPENVSSRLCY